MVLRFEIFVPATSTFEINRNGLVSDNLLNMYENYFWSMVLNHEMIIFVRCIKSVLGILDPNHPPKQNYCELLVYDF